MLAAAAAAAVGGGGCAVVVPSSQRLFLGIAAAVAVVVAVAAVVVVFAVGERSRRRNSRCSLLFILVRVVSLAMCSVHALLLFVSQVVFRFSVQGWSESVCVVFIDCILLRTRERESEMCREERESPRPTGDAKARHKTREHDNVG